MKMSLPKYGPENPDETYVAHSFDEQQYDIGEISINYAVTGNPENPAVVLIPSQAESWWGYESAMKLMSDKFQAYAVDLRGQGRSTRTHGRYTIDNFGNDIVRFITFVVRRPVIISGNSSGGVISAWLSAYAPPGMIRGAHYEDPPLFSSELVPAFGNSIRQNIGDFLSLANQFLGDQWKVGNWEGLLKATPEMVAVFGLEGISKEPPQNIKEYDPEWGRAFASGYASESCEHSRMLSQVKCPVLFTHHSRVSEPVMLRGHHFSIGAISDLQAKAVSEIISSAGQKFTYKSFPEMAHKMHDQDPELFVRTISEWAITLPSESDVKSNGVFS
jgi:pimeloyl-ACP methyl ester carboxylesterase